MAPQHPSPPLRALARRVEQVLTVMSRQGSSGGEGTTAGEGDHRARGGGRKEPLSLSSSLPSHKAHQRNTGSNDTIVIWALGKFSSFFFFFFNQLTTFFNHWLEAILLPVTHADVIRPTPSDHLATSPCKWNMRSIRAERVERNAGRHRKWDTSPVSSPPTPV
jgi:hypothetical protein